MAVNYGQISAPVSIDDVRTAIGSGSYDLATLCSNASGTINKWAKYKPIKADSASLNLKTDKVNNQHPITGSLTAMPAYYGKTETKPKTVSTSGNNVTLNMISLGGFSIPESIKNTDNDATLVMDGYSTNGCNWPYEAPVAGTNWCRLTDFDGYNHQALDPFYFQPSGAIYASDIPTFSYSINSESINTWQLDDMMEYLSSSYRYAVIVKNSAGTIIATKIGDLLTTNTASAGTLVLDNKLSAGTYKAYFVAIDRTNDRVLLLPSSSTYPNPVSFTVKSGSNPNVDQTTQITTEAIGFAYNYSTGTSTGYWESFSNVGEIDYVELCSGNSNGSYNYLAIKMTWTAKTGYNPTINFKNMSWYWPYCGADGNIAAFKVWVDGTERTGQSVTFSSGTSHTVIFELQDIYWDGSVSTSRSEGDVFDGYSFTLYLSQYNQLSFPVDIAYEPQHNGYFRRWEKGQLIYYQSR